MINSNHLPYGALYSFQHDYIEQLNHDEICYGDDHDDHDEYEAQTSSAWKAFRACMKSIFTKP